MDPRLGHMGTIHKFERPPKNEKQFKGYRPKGSGGPGAPAPRAGLWQRLRPWQQSVLMWLLLIAVAGGIVVAKVLLSSGA